MAGNKRAGSWKEGETAPVQGDYADATEYEADDSKYRRWKNSQAQDKSGGTTTTPGSQKTGGSKVVVDAAHRRAEVLTSVDAPGATGREGEGDVAAAARRASERRKKPAVGSSDPEKDRAMQEKALQ